MAAKPTGAHRCPACASVFAFRFNGNDGSKAPPQPRPGMVAMCTACAFISMFVPAQGGGLVLRPPRRDEWRAIIDEPEFATLRPAWEAKIRQLRHYG